jgi:putative ABC transport system ATP-binding protein
MSAFENVELPMTLLGKLSASERRARVSALLTRVGLRDRMHHLPSELSGGEQQVHVREWGEALCSSS